MDINGTPYHLLRGPREFAHRSPRFGWNERRDAFTLVQEQELRLAGVLPAEARVAWQGARPLVRDRFGQIGRLAADGSQVQYNAGNGFEALLDSELTVLAPPAGSFTDLAVGGDGRLVACWSDGATHGLTLFHLGRRWQVSLPIANAPRRAIVDGDDLIWCVTEDGSLLRCEGEPLPQPYRPASDRFEPLAINRYPLRQVWSQALPAAQLPLALCADEDHLYVLSHQADAQAILRRRRDRDAAAPWELFSMDAVGFCTDLALLGDGRLAAMLPAEPGDDGYRRRDCPVLTLEPAPEGEETATARLLRERYPMGSQLQPRFVGSADGKVRYQAEADDRAPGYTPRPRELHPLPRPVYPKAAMVTLLSGQGGDGLDSGRADTVWHRVYLEACIPPRGRITVLAKCFDDPRDAGSVAYVRQPAPLWNPIGCELPFHRPLVDSIPDRSGLFEILLQRPHGSVRGLSGRFLRMRIVMESDGRSSPAIHAIRVYYPRFSYQESYLPELMRQQEDRRTPAVEGMPANGADVRERMLAAFEGILTPIEGRIAASEALLHPDSAPAGQLGWWARTLGIEIPVHWPEARKRRMLGLGCLLQQWRGTYPGIRLALDIVTDGGVGRGQVVVVENFRLRRTMATILGLDMDDRDHPLTLGTGLSGNSMVGDSLILSEDEAPQILALFAPEIAELDERQAVDAFFEKYAHRVSVLLHGPARDQREQVEECLLEHMPARVQWRIIETDHPFVLGMAPLLAVDSFVEERPPAHRVTLNDTHVGREGLLANPVALSPRDVNRR